MQPPPRRGDGWCDWSAQPQTLTGLTLTNSGGDRGAFTADTFRKFRLRVSLAVLSDFSIEVHCLSRAVAGPEHAGLVPMNSREPCFRLEKRAHRDVGTGSQVLSCRISQR